MSILNESNKKIKAVFDDKKLIIYQAFNNEIAEEALKLNHFGKLLNMDRMTWIKPSFLWMMHRSNWGRKINQERILSIEIKRKSFDFMLSNAILSKYNSKVYDNKLEWNKLIKNADIICQWDPARNIYGNKLEEKTIQLGLRGEILHEYVHDWIINIRDITKTVCELRVIKSSEKFDYSILPYEKEYPIDNIIRHNLGIDRSLTI